MSEYEVITAHLINHIKKTYKWGSDIEYTLTTMTNVDFIAVVPVEGTIPDTVTDPTERDKRKASLKLVYEQEIKRYVDRTLEYEANKIKAYSFYTISVTRPCLQRSSNKQILQLPSLTILSNY